MRGSVGVGRSVGGRRKEECFNEKTVPISASVNYSIGNFFA